MNAITPHGPKIAQSYSPLLALVPKTSFLNFYTNFNEFFGTFLAFPTQRIIPT